VYGPVVRDPDRSRAKISQEDAPAPVTFCSLSTTTLLMEQHVGLERRQYREILSFVRRRANWNDAYDITQEVFADAAEHLQRSSREAPPTLGWLYTVARRRLADQARRQRVEIVSLDEAIDAPARGDNLYGIQVRAALGTGFSKLPATQRRVVALRLYEGRAFGEIASLLGLSEEACRMRFMRGLRCLREELEREDLNP
jgi:RNA polymerase sigma factor (sigma-70 family)